MFYRTMLSPVDIQSVERLRSANKTFKRRGKKRSQPNMIHGYPCFKRNLSMMEIHI